MGSPGRGTHGHAALGGEDLLGTVWALFRRANLGGHR